MIDNAKCPLNIFLHLRINFSFNNF